MAVILPDRDLTVLVRSHPWVRDSRGTPVPTDGDTIDTRGPYPGCAQENPDQSWALRIDPRCWPVRDGDTVTDGDKTWVIAGDPRQHAVPGVPDVDFIEAVGTLEPPRVP